MKRILYTLFVILALVAQACTDDALVEDGRKNGSIRVTAGISDTRTAFHENDNSVSVRWVKNDAIGLSCSGWNNLKYVAQDTGSFTDFLPVKEAVMPKKWERTYAYYPFTEHMNEEHQVLLPSIFSQYYGRQEKYDFLYGDARLKDNEINFRFKHLYTFIRLHIDLRTLQQKYGSREIILESEGNEGLCPDSCYFDLRRQEIVGESTMKSIWYSIFSSDYKYAKDSVMSCYIALLPQNAGTTLIFKDEWKRFSGEESVFLRLHLSKKLQAGRVYDLTQKEEDPSNKEYSKDDRGIMMELYDKTGGMNWNRQKNWCTDAPLKDWEGIEVDKNGHVAKISLYNNNLKGELPSSLSNLKSLWCFDVSNNQLSGNLPDFSNCRNMQVFLINNNQFSGRIPDFGELVQEYDVSYNNFTGKVPETVTSDELFKYCWPMILPQNKGYGFDYTDLPAPNHTVTCYDGSRLNLSDVYRNHKFTLVFSWLPSSSLPILTDELNRFYQKYKDKGLCVVGMNWNKHSEIDNEVALMPEIKQFWGDNENRGGTQRNRYFKHYYSMFYFQHAPVFYVVDRKGNIVHFSGRLGTLYGDFATVKQYNSTLESAYRFISKAFGDDFTIIDDSYRSTDKSKDGTYYKLQSATNGKGINLCFIGKGFVDKDYEQGGKFEMRMKQTLEDLFSLPPYTALRDRFNVYAVRYVSDSRELDGELKDEFYFNYANKVPEISNDRIKRVIILYNTIGDSGRSYCRWYDDGSFTGRIMTDYFRTLVHEIGGHGIARLRDEYVEPGRDNVKIFDFLAKEITKDHSTKWGWSANADVVGDRFDVYWHKLLADYRYANDGLTVLEGGATFGKGAYRPSQNSIMRDNYNYSWFNAISRMAIYKAVMTMSEGDNWQFDYEDFVQWDAPFRNHVPNFKTRAAGGGVSKEFLEHHRAPVYGGATWRDAR